MPQLDSTVVSLLAGVFSALTQLVKGVFLSEDAKRWLPICSVLLCSGVGTALAFYYGRDPITGLFEGVIGGLSALGVYATANSIAPKAVNTEGWLKRKS